MLKKELASAKNAREEVEKEIEELNGDAEVKKTKMHNKEVGDLNKNAELEKKLKKEIEDQGELRKEFDSSKIHDLELLRKRLTHKEQLKELTHDERLALNLERLQEHIKKVDGGSGIGHIGQEA